MKKFKIEYLFYLMIIISPFLDASSFLYRQVYPAASFSIATIIRPIIPLVLGIYIFIKDGKERRRIILFSIIYAVYGLAHLYLYKINFTDFSYGGVIHEFQYIMNYTYMISVFYIGYYFYKNKDMKYFKDAMLLMFLSYIIIIYLSIFTNTSSPTYIEGIGYKGWFASGNALSSILILLLLTLMPYLVHRKNKLLLFVVLILSFFYLTFLIGTRVGLYGFYLSLGIYIGIEIFTKILKNRKIELKKYVIPIVILIAVGVIGITFVGSKTLERRKHLNDIENNLIDPSTNSISHVTGDLANFVYKINNNQLDDDFMLDSQKQALLSMYKWANERGILNNNQRLQQIVYHTYLIKYQHDFKLLLFGNGYEINYPELTLEMEIPAVLFNFGLIGFFLYLMPFLIIDIYSLYCFFKYFKKITVEYLVYTSAAFLAIAFSFLAGYTFFNVSSMLVIILIHILLLEQLNNMTKNENINNKKRIVFGITSLTLGGAERVLVDISNALKDKYDITIFTLYGSGEFIKELDSNIKIISMYESGYNSLNKFQKIKMSIYMIIKPLRYLIYRKYIKDRYDVEIAFLEGPITWCFSFNSTSLKIAWIHNDITNVFGNDGESKLKLALSKKCYINYDKLVFVSNDNKNKFEQTYSLKNKKYVIYNYLDKDKVIQKSLQYKPDELSNKYKNFIVVSRLTEQKGIKRLIDVHDKLIKDGFKHNVYYIGDGPLKEELMEIIKEKKLDTFKLLGKRENPYPYMKKGDFILLASLYEGYGMVIEEAKILNKYIIITDTAAREALIEYKNSLIVENSFDGLYNGIKEKINNSNIEKENYSYENSDILKQIIDLIER